MPDRLAVFDLDGTLVDTAPDLADSVNVVLSAQGIDPVPPPVLQDFIGMGAKAMISQALAHNGTDPDALDMQAVLDAFLTHYSSRLTKLSRPFPEIVDALDSLDTAAVPMAVCTNKRERLARQLLDELGLLGRFVALSGGDTFGVSKPDPEHLLRTIALAGGTPQGAVFVGDSRIDFETARAAKVPLVGLSYGYSDVPMEALGPDKLCRPGDDIAKAILALC